jgi:WD40 repeat protein
MIVTRPAGAPYERLAADATKAGLDPSPLGESSHGLIEIARQLDPDESLLVVVDQFEELFRYKDLGREGEDARRRHDAFAADAAEFVQLLLAAARHQPPVYIVLTMRSDYLGDCAEFRDLPETLNDCQYLVPRMTREQRKEAILGPLGRVEMEPALVQRLLNEAGDEPDQLPVLQHALMRTWSRWRREDPEQTRRIELRDYDAVGGMKAALDRHADELVTKTPIDITATIFKRLTARGRNSRERRNPATLADLWAVCAAVASDRREQVTAVVDTFRRGEATFLVPRDGAVEADTYIDITHESLIRLWKTLRDRWLPEEQASAKTFLDLVDRARNWSEKKGEVLIGLDLSDALQWDRQRNRSRAWARHYASEEALDNVLRFIEASQDRRRQEVVRRRRLRTATGAGVIAIFAALALAGFNQYRAARVAREAAFEARILSVPSVRDPLTRALLLAELGPHAQPQHLAIYQDAASTPIPYAVFRYPESERATAAAFMSGGRTAAVLLSGGSLWSWSRDGRGDHSARGFGLPEPAKGVTPALISMSAFSGDGRWIAAGMADGSLWLGRSDAPALQRVASARSTMSRSVSSLAFSKDGRQLAVGYTDFTAQVFRLDDVSGTVANAPAIQLAGGHKGDISAIAFDAAGTRVVTGALDGAIRVWALARPARPASALDESGAQNLTVRCLSFSPDGKWLASGYDAGFFRVQPSDSQGTGDAPRIPGHAGTISSVAFSPDSSRLVTGSDDHTARIWRMRLISAVDEGQPGALMPVGAPLILTHDGRVTSAGFSADGSQVLTTADDGAMRLWAADQDEPRVVGVHSSRVESVTFSPDATRILSASDDKTARMWSLDGSTKPQVLEGHTDWVRSAVFSPSDGQKVVTTSDDGTLRWWDLAAPGRVRLSQESSTVFEGAFDRKGDRFVTAVRDNIARVWKTADLANGGSALDTSEASEIVELRHDDWVRGAAFNGDGSRIVTASRDGTVRIWAWQGGAAQPLKQFRHAGATVVSAGFSPDGTRIVTAFLDGVARIWRVDGPDQPMELRHSQDVNAAVFSSRGNWIATASRDGTARLWNARDGGERVVLRHGSESVRAVAFDSADARLVTGTGDGIVRVWRITVPALRDYLTGATTACLEPLAHVRFLGETEETGRAEFAACEKRFGRTQAEELRGNVTIGAGPQ